MCGKNNIVKGQIQVIKLKLWRIISTSPACRIKRLQPFCQHIISWAPDEVEHLKATHTVEQPKDQTNSHSSRIAFQQKDISS